MSTINFHSLKELPVPEELRNKVIAIPESLDESKKRSIHLNRFIRFAAAAVSLAIIAAVSAVIILNTGNKNTIAVRQLTKDSTVASSECSTETASVIPTEKFSVYQPLLTENRSSDTISPTEIRSTDPTDAYFADPSQHGADTHVQPSSFPVDATESSGIFPTNKPTTEPADAPTEAPTEKKDHIDLPTESSASSPGVIEPGYTPERPERIEAVIPNNSLPSDRKVYCRIESLDGQVFGEYGLFEKERLMTCSRSNNEYSVYYYRFADYFDVSVVLENESENISDLLNCFIYDSNGNILTTKYIYWS